MGADHKCGHVHLNALDQFHVHRFNLFKPVGKDHYDYSVTDGDHYGWTMRKK